MAVGLLLVTAFTYVWCSAHRVNERQKALLFTDNTVSCLNTHKDIYIYINGLPEKIWEAAETSNDIYCQTLSCKSKTTDKNQERELDFIYFSSKFSLKEMSKDTAVAAVSMAFSHQKKTKNSAEASSWFTTCSLHLTHITAPSLQPVLHRSSRWVGKL